MQKIGLVLAVLVIANSTQANAQSITISVAQFSSVDGEINIGVEEIVGVEVEQWADSSTLALSLTAGASEALERLTSRSLGREMSFSVCGEEIARPTVIVPVTSGLVQVTLTKAQALAISEVLLGQIECGELLQ